MESGREGRGHLDVELARLHAEEQVVQAVPDLGHHDHDPRLPRHGVKLVLGVVPRAQLLEGRRQVFHGRGVLILPFSSVGRTARLKVHAHEEALGGAVAELLQVGDVVPVAGEDAGHGVDDAGLVRAREREDLVVAGHFSFPSVPCLFDLSMCLGYLFVYLVASGGEWGVRCEVGFLEGC